MYTYSSQNVLEAPERCWAGCEMV